MPRCGRAFVSSKTEGPHPVGEGLGGRGIWRWGPLGLDQGPASVVSRRVYPGSSGREDEPHRSLELLYQPRNGSNFFPPTTAGQPSVSLPSPAKR
jgi:hypothetical protein